MTALNLRQQILVDTIKEIGGTPTFAEIEVALQKYEAFDLVQTDLDELEALGALNAPPIIDAEFNIVEPGDGINELPASETGVRIEPLTVDEAERAVVVATDALANARNAVNRTSRIEREKNAALAQAITQFQRAFPVYTPQQLIRDHLASEADQRRRIASGELPQKEVAAGHRSVIDRQRAWQRSGGPDAGTGNSGRAVCMDPTMPGKVYPQHLRGNVVAKPPTG